jgi:8-oxo-dGTP pyrophosphatase MutT (NUDIX family)
MKTDYTHLIPELSTFQTTHPEERATIPRFIALLQKPNPADRHDFTPGHLTASAVVLSPKNELLLIEHAKLKRWLQPGGHVEPGEFDLRQSARRELLEETALDLPETAFELFDLDIHEIPAIAGKHPAHLHYDLRYLANSPTRDLPPNAVDACNARWFSAEQLKSIDLDPGIQRMIRKLKL